MWLKLRNNELLIILRGTLCLWGYQKKMEAREIIRTFRVGEAAYHWQRGCKRQGSQRDCRRRSRRLCQARVRLRRSPPLWSRWSRAGFPVHSSREPSASGWRLSRSTAGAVARSACRPSAVSGSSPLITRIVHCSGLEWGEIENIEIIWQEFIERLCLTTDILSTSPNNSYETPNKAILEIVDKNFKNWIYMYYTYTIFKKVLKKSININIDTFPHRTTWRRHKIGRYVLNSWYSRLKISKEKRLNW